MKIIWKLRLQNKTTLLALIVLVVDFIYNIFAEIGITPKIDKSVVLQFVNYAISLLAILGVVVDPTTDGIGDSENALNR